jgi:hypothetical protein
MIRRCTAQVLGALLAIGLSVASEIHGQVWSLDVGYDQSFTSLDPLPSPTGYALAVAGMGLWGPLGIQASFRGVSERGGTVDQSCGLASCAMGPFDQTHTMRTAGFGLSYDLVSPMDLRLSLVFSGTATWQVERLRHVETGERSTLDAGGADVGASVAAYLGLRPLLLGLRPRFGLRYDRVFASDCVPDAPCWPGRDVFGVSAGVGWVFGAGPGT